MKKPYWELIDYLECNIQRTNFIDKHTRKEFAEILRMLFPHATNGIIGARAFTQMCKKRQCAHIEFWLKSHGRLS